MFFPQLPHCNKRLTIGIRHPIDTKYDHSTYRCLRPLNQATLQPKQLFVSRIMQIRVLNPSCLLPQMNTNWANHETRFHFFACHRGIHIKHLMLLEVDFTTSYLKDDNSNRMVRTCYYLIRVSGTSSCLHVVPKHDLIVFCMVPLHIIIRRRGGAVLTYCTCVLRYSNYITGLCFKQKPYQ